MSRRFDTPARLQVEAMQRLLSLCVAGLALFAVSLALHWVPSPSEGPSWDAGAGSLDLSFHEQRQLLDKAMAHATTLRAR